MKKCGSRVKTQKGSLEQKQNFKDSWAVRTKKTKKKWKGNDLIAPEAFMRSSTPSKIDKPEPSLQEHLPQIFEFITVDLDACQIAIFRDKKK